MTDLRQYEGLELLLQAEVDRVQAALLVAHLRHAAENSPFYRATFKSLGLDPGRMTAADLPRLPFTDKSHFEQRMDDLIAVPQTKVRDIVLSSGTTGQPTKMLYTESDLARLAFNEKTAFMRLGLGPGDIALLTCTLDRCFIAGLAYYEGIRAVGAAAVRNGLSSLASHFEIIRRMSPTALVGVPTFLYKLGLYIKDQGIDPRSTGVKKLICIGEPLRDRNLDPLRLGASLESIWDAHAYSTYASSETVTSFCECEERRGGHLHPALGIVEIIDDNGNPLPPGEVGEVVMTPLITEGVPLIRFRTGDVSFVVDGPCKCGRNSVRLGPVLGRKKQMIKCQGTTLYPQAINAVLDEIPEVSEYYIIATSDFDLSDRLEVHVAIRGGGVTAEAVAERLQARLRVKPRVFQAEEAAVRGQVYSEKSRKPIRFIDRR